MRIKVDRISFLCVFALSCFFGYAVNVSADIVYLKNGRNIEGLVKSENNAGVELEVGAGTVTFQRSEIESVQRVSLREAAALRDKWEEQKKEFQKKIQENLLQEAGKPKEVEFSSGTQGIVLAVILNNKIEASLVLDTGATVVILSSEVARKLGIKIDKVAPDMKLAVADGREINAKHIYLESVKTQGVEAKRVEAAVMLEGVGGSGIGDGLLGMSFLKQFTFQVDYGRRKLVLEKL